MKNKKIINEIMLSILSGFFLLGCVEVLDESPPAPKSAPVSQRTPPVVNANDQNLPVGPAMAPVNVLAGKLIEDRSRQLVFQKNQSDVEYLLFENDLPKKYDLYLVWGQRGPIKVDMNGNIVWSSDEKTPPMIQLILDHNQQYQIRVQGSEGGVLTEISKLTFGVPKDYLLSSQNLERDTEMVGRRVFVDSDALIQTNGFDLKVNSLKFILKSKAEIRSFAAGAKALLDRPGRSGGVVQVHSEYAEGDLVVVMRGEGGGDGSPGAPWPRASEGVRGERVIMNCFKNQVSDQMSGGVVLSYRTEARCQCEKPRKGGGPGADGLAGRQGSSGRRGGNSGRMDIIIGNVQNFTLKPVYEFGAGGEPGGGGPGQIGGDGGAISDFVFKNGGTEEERQIFASITSGYARRGVPLEFWDYNCFHSAAVQPGPRGKDGGGGSVGQREGGGAIENSCIRLGDSKVLCQ